MIVNQKQMTFISMKGRRGKFNLSINENINKVDFLIRVKEICLFCLCDEENLLGEKIKREIRLYGSIRENRELSFVKSFLDQFTKKVEDLFLMRKKAIKSWKRLRWYEDYKKKEVEPLACDNNIRCIFKKDNVTMKFLKIF